jgi:2-oxoglutarate ferredoxin oxidoreductase subunit gamma
MLTEISIAGSGGQGIQFIGQLLAKAATRQGLIATYVPSYGAERRGGPSFCSVVIGDSEIFSPVFIQADVLLALDQRGREQGSSMVKSNGLILVNQDLAGTAVPGEKGRVVALHATQMADELGPSGPMNLIMAAAYVGVSGIINPQGLEEELREVTAKKPQLLTLNLGALAQGLKWGQEHKK